MKAKNNKYFGIYFLNKLNKIIIYLIKKILFCIFFILFFVIIFIIINNIVKNKYKNSFNNTKYSKYSKCQRNYSIKKSYSKKWIVITTINPPAKVIYKLLNISQPWKIVVIGDKNTKDENWNQFKLSKKLFYLSLKDQLSLCYHITNFIPFNSYSRKNIGYLYAIENGAQEIFEIDDNVDFQNFDYSFNKTKFKRYAYAKNINNSMINPYPYFGLESVWPRGFRLNDIGKEFNNKFYNLASNQIKLTPLIYQGLINGEPDIDSIFIQTRMKKNSKNRIHFFNNIPLLYLPGNYISINSKNTKYLYKVFPLLPLPISLNKRISDIFRGYIMQRYIWSFNGIVLFHSSSFYKVKNKKNDYINFLEEKDFYYRLDEFLNILSFFT